ncbi:MAG: ABC transporter permease [Halarsenatibacteraceae bacterium]
MKNNLKEILFNILVLLGSFIIALIFGSIILLIAGVNPLVAYHAMIIRPISSVYGLSEAVVRAIPLMMVGIGISIAFRSKMINIGGEGQIQLGAIAAGAAALALPGLPKFILIPIVILVGFTAGGIWGGLAGWMKAKLSVNEVLSTVMLNYIAFQIYLYLIRGPLIDPSELAWGTGVPQTARMPDSSLFQRLIQGQRIHSGIFIAIIIAFLVYFLLWRTTFGFRLRAVGEEPKAANYAGVKVDKYLVLAMILSGGLAGIAGSIEVIGVHHRVLEGLSANYGFSGIVVALFGRLHPLGVIPASFFFGLLLIGAEMMQRAVDIPSALVISIQGLVILAVVSSNLLLENPKYRKKFLSFFVQKF